MAAAADASPRNAERRFYGLAALIAALLVFAGFARTWYLGKAFDAPELPGLVHLHGVVMTGWIVLFGVQASLVAARRVDLHRRLGMAGAFFAALVVVMGIATAIEGARRGISPGPPPLVFLAIPLGVILVFGALVAAAVANRRRPDWHKRLMLLATISMLTPAIARLPIEALHAGGIVAFFAITDLLAIACIAWDTARNRRLHPAFLRGAIFLVASQPAMLVLAQSAAWQPVARWLAG
ncbi:MAG: hypothetical protein KIS74_15475 [Burkholderiales bacterium]|nr:hypothetical protein [Burkholderiales bacterium]